MMRKRKMRKRKKSGLLFLFVGAGIFLMIVFMAWLALGGPGSQKLSNKVMDKASLMADRMDELVSSFRRRSGPPQTRPSVPAADQPQDESDDSAPMEEPLTEQERQNLNELLESSP